MSDKIKINRIKETIPPLAENINKLVYIDNGNINYIDRKELPSLCHIDNTINSFKILSTENTNITYNNGSVMSQDNQKMLSFDGGTIDTNKSILDNGSGDKLVYRTWNQPIFTNYNQYSCEITASSEYSAEYRAWEAFNGTNASNTDCWHSLTSAADYPHWLQIKLPYPIRVEKFIIQNRQADATTSGTVFDILASQDGINWDTLVSVNNKDIIPNTVANAINEYIANNTQKEYTYFKYVNYKSTHAQGYVTIGRFLIVGQYVGYRIPNQKYNIFAIGDNNFNTKLLTSIDEIPTLPENYIYYTKIGNFETDFTNNTIKYFPKNTIVEEYEHGRVIAESLTNIGYRIYSDGWKIQWGNNVNPIFPVAFDDIPVIIERDATNVTRTGMTLSARYWTVEGY